MSKVWIVEGITKRGCDNTIDVFETQNKAICFMLKKYMANPEQFEEFKVDRVLAGIERGLVYKKKYQEFIAYYYLTGKKLN